MYTDYFSTMGEKITNICIIASIGLKAIKKVKNTSFT